MYRYKEIIERVKKLKKKYQTNDPYEIAENLNINIWERDFGTDDSSIKALIFKNARISYIGLNSNLPEIIAVFILAHELGHYILHNDKLSKCNTENTFFGTDCMEIEANLFAAELLIDDDEILDELEDDELTQYQIASKLHVPYQLLAYKIMLLKNKGYTVPELPETPKSNFLSGSLGMDEDWECYYVD